MGYALLFATCSTPFVWPCIKLLTSQFLRYLSLSSLLSKVISVIINTQEDWKCTVLREPNKMSVKINQYLGKKKLNPGKRQQEQKATRTVPTRSRLWSQLCCSARSPATSQKLPGLRSPHLFWRKRAGILDSCWPKCTLQVWAIQLAVFACSLVKKTIFNF